MSAPTADVTYLDTAELEADLRAHGVPFSRVVFGSAPLPVVAVAHREDDVLVFCVNRDEPDSHAVQHALDNLVQRMAAA